MTSYQTPIEIYISTLRELFNEQADETMVRARIASESQVAALERDAANQPGYRRPFVGHIPAWGSEDRISAMEDYCALRNITDSRETLRLILLNALNQCGI